MPEISDPLDKSTSRKLINIIGFFIILKALGGLLVNANYERYAYICGWLATEMLERRYLFSWFYRIYLLVCGVGILLRRELLRRLMVAWSVIAILCTYWMHPYQAFANVYDYYGINLESFCRYLEHSGLPAFSPEQLIGGSMIAAWIVDGVIYFSFIYFLSEKAIKSHFR